MEKKLGVDVDGEKVVTWDHKALLEKGGLKSSLAGKDGLSPMDLLAIWESGCCHASDMMGKEFPVSDFIAGPCHLGSPYVKEVVEATRLVLLGPCNRPVALTEIGCFAGLQEACEEFGSQPPWEPPVWFIIKFAGRGKKNLRVVLQAVRQAPVP